MFELPSALPLLPACPHREAPPSSQRLLKRAERHIAHKHYARAVSDLRRAIALGADAYVCTLRIADLEWRQHRWECALCAAEQATMLAPDRTIAWEMLVTISLQAKDFPRAIAASQALIKRRPRDPAAYDALGAIYLQMGDVAAALRVLNTLLRLHPHSAVHHFKKGLLCQHQGEIALAGRAFAACLELEPNGPHAAEARDALETLDACQLNNILTLGMEDAVFRALLLRDAASAAAERGFTLSEQGGHILAELCAQLLPYCLDTCRAARYN
jgi:tetratricopeptide (TPR) repeat protein